MRFIRLIIALTVLSVLAACTQHRKADYTTLLFDISKVHTINVQISEADWQDLLAHEEEKTKYEADIVIDGELMEQVAFFNKREFQPGSCQIQWRYMLQL